MPIFRKKPPTSQDTSQRSRDTQCGVHLLYKSPEPKIDIIAVHGLGGHPLNTWTTQGTGQPVLWLKELLPEPLPDARILSYGYDANFSVLFGSTSSDRILQHSRTLVSQLVADREADNALNRPIIFICHSLGGIIVKRALAFSASQSGSKISHLSSLMTSSLGVIFLATPHYGSSKADWALIIQRALKVLTPSLLLDNSDQLLKILREGSEVLQDVTDMFVPLMKDLRISFFWEQHKMKLPTGYSYIVHESSAAPIISNTERCGIPGDHRTICRFQNASDAGFKVVLAAILRCKELIPYQYQEASASR